MGIDGRTRGEFLRGSLRLTGNLVAPSLVVGSTSWLSPRFRAMAAAAPSRAASDEALRRLQQGNRRYVAGWATHSNQTAAHRTAVARKQAPFALILGCSDSRVPPEVVFDQGIGDLFTVRVAGNVASDDSVIGSIEYAVEELRVPLIMVLGHERCGAVEAAVGVVTKNARLPGHIAGLVRPIEPAVRQAQKHPGDLVDNSVRANVGLTVTSLASSEPIVAEAVHKGTVKIIGARYDLETGVVEVIV